MTAIIALLASVTTQSLLRSRTTSYESTAISNLRVLMSGLETYRSVNGRFPPMWQANMYTTADPDYGPASFNKPLEGEAGDVVTGYAWDYDGTVTGTSYALYAFPQNASTGTRVFYADETGAISHCLGGTLAKSHINDGSEAKIDQPVDACD